MGFSDGRHSGDLARPARLRCTTDGADKRERALAHILRESLRWPPISPYFPYSMQVSA